MSLKVESVKEDGAPCVHRRGPVTVALTLALTARTDSQTVPPPLEMTLNSN